MVDTTGCGDGFNAGLLTGLLLGCDPVDAAWLGAACGSLVATGLGSDAGMRDLAHALEILRTSNAPAADRIEAAALSGAAAEQETGEHVACQSSLIPGQFTAQVMPAQSMPATSSADRPREADGQLRQRAGAVIPGGMYGHQSAGPLPPEYPQFMRGGRGARIWDVDGNEYVDLMCSYGPVVLGHQHPAVEAAARAQAEQADCQNGPGAVMVELAELLVATVRHADWAMFAKNGTDATTICCTIARAQTGQVTHPGGDGRVPRRGAVVHAAAGRRHQRGPGQPRLLHL